MTRSRNSSLSFLPKSKLSLAWSFCFFCSRASFSVSFCAAFRVFRNACAPATSKRVRKVSVTVAIFLSSSLFPGLAHCRQVNDPQLPHGDFQLRGEPVRGLHTPEDQVALRSSSRSGEKASTSSVVSGSVPFTRSIDAMIFWKSRDGSR